MNNRKDDKLRSMRVCEDTESKMIETISSRPNGILDIITKDGNTIEIDPYSPTIPLTLLHASEKELTEWKELHQFDDWKLTELKLLFAADKTATELFKKIDVVSYPGITKETIFDNELRNLIKEGRATE